jgi:hypothetical protein
MPRFLLSWFVLATASALCASCSRPEPPKTVAYYKGHTAERDARIAVCKNDPGTLKNDPDCINAISAGVSSWGSATLPPVTFDSTASAAPR